MVVSEVTRVIGGVWVVAGGVEDGSKLPITMLFGNVLNLPRDSKSSGS